MATNIRQQIITKLDTLLKTIKTTAGYETNLGNSVSEWLEIPLTDTAGPACAYKETVTSTGKAVGLWENTMELNLFLYGNTATQVRQMIADVIKAIGTKKTWDGLALDTKPAGEDVGAEQKKKLVFIARITFNITYITAYWSAY